MPHGTVIVIGGAEDKVRDRVILGRFVALAGGRPLALFGEWWRDRLRPLSAFAEGRFVLL